MLFKIFVKALESWSGQEVDFFPHFIPDNFSIASLIFISFNKELSPKAFPGQPPTNKTSLILLSLISNLISEEHTPLVL